MMEFIRFFISAYILSGLVQVGHFCSPVPGFKFLTFEQSLYKSNLVLYGRDMTHNTYNDTTWEERIDSIFQVFCVLKNTNSYVIKENITIHRVYPRNTCETSSPTAGKDYIVLLKKRMENNTYEWAPPKDIHKAKFDVSDEDYLNKARVICGFQNMTVPEGRSSSSSPACPASVQPSSCTVPPASAADKVFSQVPLLLSLLTLIFLAGGQL